MKLVFAELFIGKFLQVDRIEIHAKIVAEYLANPIHLEDRMQLKHGLNIVIIQRVIEALHQGDQVLFPITEIGPQAIVK